MNPTRTFRTVVVGYRVLQTVLVFYLFILWILLTKLTALADTGLHPLVYISCGLDFKTVTPLCSCLFDIICGNYRQII